MGLEAGLQKIIIELEELAKKIRNFADMLADEVQELSSSLDEWLTEFQTYQEARGDEA